MNYAAEDVFISYSSKDQATAEKIKRLLESPPRSVSCWMANDVTIASGDDFRSRIVEAIRSCKVFLFILSESSMNSHWCSLELSFAILENKKIYSIKIDDKPINDICSFKLGCAQISDGTVNFEAVVEALAINVKNGRDHVLEEEKKRISNIKRHSPVLYILSLVVSRFFGVAILVSLIYFIRTAMDVGGIFMLLMSSESDLENFDAVMTSLKIAVYSLFPYIAAKILGHVSLSSLSRGAKIGSPSALYSLYLITARFGLITRFIGKKQSLMHLHKSAELGYAPAIRERDRLSQKGKI